MTNDFQEETDNNVNGGEIEPLDTVEYAESQAAQISAEVQAVQEQVMSYFLFSKLKITGAASQEEALICAHIHHPASIFHVYSFPTQRLKRCGTSHLKKSERCFWLCKSASNS
jgi:hypothetical protein